MRAHSRKGRGVCRCKPKTPSPYGNRFGKDICHSFSEYSQDLKDSMCRLDGTCYQVACEFEMTAFAFSAKEDSMLCLQSREN